MSHLLATDDTLEDRTSIPPEDICQLVELCLRCTYFQFDGELYEQIGAAMGSPLSPVVANLYMEFIENPTIQTATNRPKKWIRYMDDTFIIWPHGQEKLNQFHNHLNGL